ncbi:MAG: YqaJ viral recombinase family protein [Candidatus Microbacterium colombiense]|nr:MAG: YqaJ viral recombinase family protein [Microbacterium sp.]
MTPQIIADAVTAVRVASQDNEVEWLDARADGVTASEVPKLSPTTWSSLLSEKLNGSKFRGNAHTERGHDREPEILSDLEWATESKIYPNRHVWAAAANRRHLATPDGFQILPNGRIRGAEVKNHKHGWKPPKRVIPRDHYDQMQFGMHVTGLDEWLYGWEIMGADGTAPTADPEFRIVKRNQARIDELVAAADAFLAWIDAGAPVEEISPELETAKTKMIVAKRAAIAATAADAKARAEFEKLLAAEFPDAMKTGWKHGDDSSVILARPARKTVIDEAAWSTAEPDGFTDYDTARTAVKTTEEHAVKLYPQVTYSKPALRVVPPKAVSA